MKKLITLSLMAICFIQTGQAQIKKGSVSIGGNLYGGGRKVIGYDNSTQNRVNYIYFNISGGKAVKNNFVTGISAGYGQELLEDLHSFIKTKRKDRSWHAGGFITSYHKLVKDLYFFTTVGAGYSHGRTRTRDSLGTVISGGHSNSVSASLSPGISYRVYRRLYLELMTINAVYAEYNVDKPALPFENTQKSFSVGTNLTQNILNNMGIGFRFII